MRVYASNMPGIGLGNKMFINAFARVLSKKTGKELVPMPIEMFSNTQKWVPPIPLINPIFTSKYGYQNVNMEELWKHSGDIVVDSYVQKYSYYTDHKEDLKDFYFEYSCDTPTIDGLTLHIRNGDYKILDWYLGLDAYEKIIQTLAPSSLHIVVENVDDDILTLRDKYGANIVASDMKSDFIHIVRSKEIVISQSTFAWWAAFLGNPEHIHIPISRRGISKGLWVDNPGTDDINLLGGFNSFSKIIL